MCIQVNQYFKNMNDNAIYNKNVQENTVGKCQVLQNIITYQLLL
jgi:hypothetical protein